MNDDINHDTSHRGDDGPIDLSSLDLTRDTVRFDHAISSILADAELRRSSAGLLRQASRWIRPALAAALPIGAIAAGALLTIHPAPATRAPDGPDTGAIAVGIPPRIIEWTRNTGSPPPLELVAELNHAGTHSTRR